MQLRLAKEELALQVGTRITSWTSMGIKIQDRPRVLHYFLGYVKKLHFTTRILLRA